MALPQQPSPWDPPDSDPMKDHFLYPYRSRAHSDLSPGQILFSANLQEFAQKVSLMCALESNGKLTPHETFEQIRQLWQSLERSKGALLDGQSGEL